MATIGKASRGEIVAIISSAHGHGSGAEAVLEQLVLGWQHESITLRLFSPRGARVSAAAEQAGIEVVPLDTTHDSALRNFLAMARRRRALQACKLVHAWHSRTFELVSAVQRLSNVAATASVHDHPANPTHGFARRQLMMLSARRLDGLAYVSTAVREAWESKLPPTLARTIPNGLVEVAVPNRESDRLRIGFLGLNDPGKGLPIVATWIERTRHLPITWTLYGDPHATCRPVVDRLLATDSHRVKAPGRKRATEIFENVDMLVHASTEFDSLPTVLLEAARSGIPVVASDVGGAREVVEDGRTGMLYPVGDGEAGLVLITQLARSPELRARLGNEARRRYETRFTVDRMVHAYAEFWSAAMAARRETASRAP